MDEKLLKQIAGYAQSAYNYSGEITEDTTFVELGKGSMKMIALTSMIENELDAEVPIMEVMKMKTIGELVQRVSEEL